MAKKTFRKWRGLATAPDQLHAPEGSLAAAVGVSGEREGVIVPRRGRTTYASVTGYRNIHRGWSFQDVKMVHVDDGGGVFRIFRDNAGTWTDLGTSYKHASDSTQFKLNHVELDDVLILAEASGLRRLESPSSSTGFLGVPFCPDLDRSNSTLTTNAAGVLQPQSVRAYRALIEVRPTDGSPVRTGSPSGRMVLRNINAAGAGNQQIPVIRVLLPKAVNTTSTAMTAGATWVQLYASESTATLSEEPSDTMGLIYDYLLTSGDITAGFVDITDVTADSLRGSALYTNKTQEGILSANEPPPHAMCVSSYKGCVVAGNTYMRHRMPITLLATNPTGAGSTGIKNGETLTITGDSTFTITAKTAPAASTEYKLENTGSVSLDIQLTAQNIVAAINRHTSNTSVYARYVGSPDDPRTLGAFVLEARTVTGGAIAAFVGTGHQKTCFEPQLPETAASASIQSSQDIFENGWAISKPHQLDAWPLEQSGRMGRGQIIHVAALDDAAFFFHDSGEIWTLTGEPPFAGDPGTLTVELRFTNVTLLAPNTVQVLDGRLIAWTDRGVIAMTANGFEVLSKDIEPTLRTHAETVGLSSVRQKAWAAVHPSERRYVLGFLNGEWQQITYYANTNAWVTDSSQPYSAGFYSSANSENKLYFCESQPSSAPKVLGENASTPSSNYNDNGGAISSTVTLPPFVADAGTPKQVREVQVEFEGSQPSSVSATITTELTSAGVTVSTQGTNLLRIPVPLSVQRGVRHTLSLTMGEANVAWKLSSVSFLFRPYEERGSK